MFDSITFDEIDDLSDVDQAEVMGENPARLMRVAARLVPPLWQPHLEDELARFEREI
jgi:hypothetical protein